MRPTLSEMGVYDGCALMEFKTKKEIVYLLNKESVCTYEMDDTPPFPINQEALDIAIEIALLFNCQIVDEMHIARKQYLDGSIPTGFQRTAIVGINGYIDMPAQAPSPQPFPQRGEGVIKRIRIRQLSIEEDACREVEDAGHTIHFRTDRLGMPLIEVVTEPDFETPREAALGVKTIGRLLRATRKVRRGIGSVRQDVNVSIEGGRRVEIKGVPRYQLIGALTQTEALRQKALLDLRLEFLRRGLSKELFVTQEMDLTAKFGHTQSAILKNAVDRGFKIRGAKYFGIAGLLNWGTQPGKTFANELSGRVRVISCLDSIPNLFHTDHYPDYTGSHIDFNHIRNALEIGDKDVAVIVWGPEADTITATNEIRDRILEVFDGVPHETRQHLRGGLTDFERILPGADRMYPDTDHPPLKIESSRIICAAARLPERTQEVEARFRSFGLPEDTIEYLALSPYKTTVDVLAKNGADMKLAGRLLGQVLPSLSRRVHHISKIPQHIWQELILACQSLGVHRKHLNEIVLEIVNNSGQDIFSVVGRYVVSPSFNNPPCDKHRPDKYNRGPRKTGNRCA